MCDFAFLFHEKNSLHINSIKNDFRMINYLWVMMQWQSNETNANLFRTAVCICVESVQGFLKDNFRMELKTTVFLNDVMVVIRVRLEKVLFDENMKTMFWASHSPPPTPPIFSWDWNDEKGSSTPHSKMKSTLDLLVYHCNFMLF